MMYFSIFPFIWIPFQFRKKKTTLQIFLLSISSGLIITKDSYGNPKSDSASLSLVFALYTLE